MRMGSGAKDCLIGRRALQLCRVERRSQEDLGQFDASLAPWTTDQPSAAEPQPRTNDPQISQISQMKTLARFTSCLRSSLP